MKRIGRIKLLFVIDSFHIGGAERSLCTLLNLLPQDRFEIHVLVTVRGGDLEKYLPDGIKIFETVRRQPGMVTGIVYAINRLRHALLSRMTRRPDGPNPAERFWRLLGRLTPSPDQCYDVAVAYHQGFPTYYVATKVKARRKIAWINADIIRENYSADFNRDFYTIYNKVVTASEKLRDLLVEAGRFRPDELIPIRDSVSPDILMRLAEETPRRCQEEADPTAPLRLLTVGRLVTVKGYDLLIEAASRLKELKVDFRWDIIGDGPLRDALRSMIIANDLENQICLKGAMDNPYPLMRDCDIYVQPSRSEGYGIAVCEAKVFLRPVIVTDFRVASGLVDNGRNGLIAEMSGQSIADCVIKLRNPDLRRKFSDELSRSASDDTAGNIEKIISLLTTEPNTTGL